MFNYYQINSKFIKDLKKAASDRYFKLYNNKDGLY